MKTIIFVLVLFLLVLTSGIGIVSAETVTGTLGSSGWNTTNYNLGTASTAGGDHLYTEINFNHIDQSAGVVALILWPADKDSFDSGAPAGTQTPVTFRKYVSHLNYTGAIIGTGTIGYQRLWNTATPPVEQPGFVYVTFDDGLNVSGLSGDYVVELEYDHTAVYNITSYGRSSGTTMPSSPAGQFFQISTSTAFGGLMTIDRLTGVSASYTATKPAGLGIQGTVTKDTMARIFVANSNNTILTNEISLTDTTYNFTVSADQIYICALGDDGIFYNSSLLFSPGGTGTPTPTPTTTAEPTPAAGYVRTYAHVKDRGGNLIHGANINIKDTFGNTWRNSSSDADGISYIDTLPNAYINIYADYTVFENEFLPGSLLTQAVGSGGNTYYLILYPYESGASAGNVSLYVEVKDTDGSYIPYANVQIVLSNGYSYAGSTANLGSKVFLVPNNTIVRATGSAVGYTPATVIGNSGTGGSMTMTINLNKQVVTVKPTSTIPPGGVTPAITVDPNDPSIRGGDTSFKAQEMMNFLAMNGMELVQVCFMVTLLALLGFKFGK